MLKQLNMEGRKRRRGTEEHGRVKGWREGARKRREEREQRDRQREERKKKENWEEKGRQVGGEKG